MTSYVSEQLGFRSDVYLQDVVELGCGAAIPTLRTVEGILGSSRIPVAASARWDRTAGPRTDLGVSRQVLSEYGNMSSPSVLFALERACAGWGTRRQRRLVAHEFRGRIQRAWLPGRDRVTRGRSASGAVS